jgi:N-glycosylase/DNA lyase
MTIQSVQLRRSVTSSTRRAAPQSARSTLPTRGVVTLHGAGANRRIVWGEPWQLGSAAYWVACCDELAPRIDRHALGASLAEEVAACILGGYGTPAPVGLAAFTRLRREGLLDLAAAADGATLELALCQPLDVGSRRVRYRFAAQRGHRLAGALAGLRHASPPSDAIPLRNWLQQLPGIGPKTASWIVRNYLATDEVAIIDVHIQRAGVIAGVFDPQWTPARSYAEMEGLFLAWASHGQVSAAALDAVIWSNMAQMGRAAMRTLGVRPGTTSWYTS